MIDMHQFLRKEKNSTHLQLKNCYCPYCWGNMGYRYLEEELYSVKCSNKNCSSHRFVYAKNPYMAIINAGGIIK